MRRQNLKIFCVMALAGLALLGCSASPSGQLVSGAVQEVVISGRKFNLQLALDPATRFKGLSDRKYIPENGGMIFVFRNAQVLHFVMRRCLVPVDIIFLSGAGRVVKTYRMKVQPYNTPEDRLTDYSSIKNAQFAIELKGGSLDKLNIVIGDKIVLPFHRLISKAK